MGESSPMDVKLADFLGNTLGRVEEKLGFANKGLWTSMRVRGLAHTINDLVYMGGLGFKPFSAMRNLFQPLMLVPTDLGGAKDIAWYFKGLRASTKKDVRTYIEEIGLIQDYAPELYTKALALPHGPVVKGIELPTKEKVRDVAMWMFKMSDRFNRYTTGGAAIRKWDHFAEKFFDETSGVIAEGFDTAMNIGSRNRWIRDEIRHRLSQGGRDNLDKAKEVFVKDVVADTQYLYGITDSPLLSHTWGAPGKMALIFQSWWMNYGTLLEKWVRTGNAPDKASRLFAFMLTTAAAEQVMEPLWGRGTAGRTVGFGPFPGEINEFLIPPTFSPVYHGLSALINLGKMDVDTARRHGKELLKSTIMFMPGGLEGKALVKGATEEGFPGFVKAIGRFKQDDDYKPLGGLGQ